MRIVRSRNSVGWQSSQSVVRVQPFVLSWRKNILYFLVIYALKQPPLSSPIRFPPDSAAFQQVLDIGQLDEECADTRRLLDAVPKTAAKRRREFAAGRLCAESCLRDLQQYEARIGVAADRSPVWPDGFVGSISHTDKVAWAAVGCQDEFRGIGIDCEQIVNETTIEETRSQIAEPEELSGLQAKGFSLREAFSLTFSVKEAIYKCLYPLGIKSLQFRDLYVSDVTDANVLVRLPQTCSSFDKSIRSQFAFDRDHIFTMCTLRA